MDEMMKRFSQPSRQAHARKMHMAYNHKVRRHYHTLMVAAGYTPEIYKVEPNGRIRRSYSYTVAIPLRGSPFIMHKESQDGQNE